MIFHEDFIGSKCNENIEIDLFTSITNYCNSNNFELIILKFFSVRNWTMDVTTLQRRKRQEHVDDKHAEHTLEEEEEEEEVATTTRPRTTKKIVRKTTTKKVVSKGKTVSKSKSTRHPGNTTTTTHSSTSTSHHSSTTLDDDDDDDDDVTILPDHTLPGHIPDSTLLPDGKILKIKTNGEKAAEKMMSKLKDMGCKSEIKEQEAK